jgi:FkbM family methyltransferase
LVNSSEPDLQWFPGYSEVDLTILDAFANPKARAEPGFVVDFMGGRVRSSSLWESARALDGQLLGPPVPGDYHAETIEWLGVLKSVASASSEYRAMELGAGFGPWSMAAGIAARHMGLYTIRLCAVEADTHHFNLLRQNFHDNGFNPDDHAVINAAVGVQEGAAQWPVTENPLTDWGCRPLPPGSSQDGIDLVDYRGHNFKRTTTVKVVSMAGLLQLEAKWDLIHVDVQGLEAELCRSVIDDLNFRSHWLVIGTHSRKIEGDLLELLCAADWVLEHEKPVRFQFQQKAATLEAMTTVDGTQVWRNPRWRR